MDKVNWKNAQDLCTLIRCALRSESPVWEGMDFPAIYELAKQHALAAMTFIPLEKVVPPERMGTELWNKWRLARDMAVRKNLRLDVERQHILRELDAMGCWYVPLKGSVLAGMYPETGMREMADNDILIDPAFRKSVKELFVKRGYEVKLYKRSNHDMYLKAPVYNFEMHATLINNSAPAKIEKYYLNIKSRLLPAGGMEKKFSDEDFYLYLLAHGYKHYYVSGNGIRFLLDCYVYLKERKLDWAYIAAELDKLELTDFERTAHSLAQKVFGNGGNLTEEEQAAFAHYMESNPYGTMEQEISNSLERSGRLGKMKYMWCRFWPDQRWFVHNASFYAKWRILKPFFVGQRCLEALIGRRRKILNELKLLLLSSPEKHDEKDMEER